MSAKIQEFQVNFMEIIDDISDDIPNDKYVMLCKDLKDNYNNFEDIQNKLKEYEESGVENMEREIENMEREIEDMEEQIKCYEKFRDNTDGFMNFLNIRDIFYEMMVDEIQGKGKLINLKEVKSRIKDLKCNCDCDCEEDYESKYKELVNRIKNTSKSQLQKLKNEL